jgi:hypothetical protein
MKSINEESDEFKIFLDMWNHGQGQKTPKLHREMAEWLELSWKCDVYKILLMAFRSAGKSSIAGLFAAWLIYKNPNIRILVLAADSALAGKMVRNVKRIIERHPCTMHLKPDNADQWASDRFTVRRTLELRDPTMLAKGVISNVTGSRADVVICDYVEVPNTSDSPDKRADLRERLSEIPYVLAKGTQLYIGTPHHYYSIYADTPRGDINEEQPFLNGFDRFTFPILDKDGNSAWPEEYSQEYIAQKRKDDGPNKFDSQMMLRPVNIMEGRLNPDLLHPYDDEIVYDCISKGLYLGSNKKMAGASCWWDPAFGAAKGDDSVCAIVYTDEGGDFFLQHLEYIKVDENDKTDEATQQARIVAKLAKKYYLPSVSIEINGIGRFLPNILRNQLAIAHCPTRVTEVTSRRSKAVRIIEGFDALMASERLYVHKQVMETPFLMEMREWVPSGYGVGKSSKGKDDALDAVAGALKQQPDRLDHYYGKGAHSWQSGSKTLQSKSVWDP